MQHRERREIERDREEREGEERERERDRVKGRARESTSKLDAKIGIFSLEKGEGGEKKELA